MNIPVSDWGRLKYIFRITNIKGSKLRLFSSILLSLFSAGCEGLSAGLLFPLGKGLIARDFSFLEKARYLKNIFAYLPQIFPNRDISIFSWLLVLFFLLWLAKEAFSYASAYIFLKLENDMSVEIKKNVFRRFFKFGKLYFDRSNVGHLLNLTGGYGIMGILLGMKNIINGFFVISVYFLLMLKISWQLTLFAVPMLPVFYYSVIWINNRIKKTSRDAMSFQKKLWLKESNIVSCMPLVKSYKREQEEESEVMRIARTFYNFNISIAKKGLLRGPINEFIGLSFISIIVLMMVRISLNNPSVNTVNFIVYFYILRRFAASAAVFNSFKSTMAGLSGKLEEFLVVFSDEDKFFVQDGSRDFTGLNRGIELRDLSFSYIAGNKVLNNLSLNIEKNKTTAIVGATGAGKTTLISLLMRFYECPAGSIFIDDVDIRDFSIKSLMRHIALVSQDTFLLNGTIRENIIYGIARKVSDDELYAASQKARLHDFLIKLPDGLDTLIGDRGVRLSGGEKQRLAIARAILKEPDILILDEATSSLDSITEQLIQEAIDIAIKDRTAIVIAHRLSTIKKADKIALIESGSLIEGGALQELLDRKGRFYNYWQAQKFD